VREKGFTGKELERERGREEGEKGELRCSCCLRWCSGSIYGEDSSPSSALTPMGYAHYIHNV